MQSNWISGVLKILLQFLESGFKHGIQNPSLSWIYIITCTGREVSRQNNVKLLRTAEILETTCKSRKEWEIGVYVNIAVVSFFMRYFGNFNFNERYCGII